MALRTSLVTRSWSTPSSNSMKVDEKPSPTVELMWRTWPRPAIESSIRRVTWVSSSLGAAPGRDGVDDHERQVDVGIVVDPHAAEAGDAGDGQQHEQQDDGDRVLDRPGEMLFIGAGSIAFP
jgi:hypothetical protein